jgi:hypothetical protein
MQFRRRLPSRLPAATAQIAAAVVLATTFAPRASAVQDVLLQTLGGAIVSGIVDDVTSMGSLGTRVHPGSFLSNFRSADPGFFSLAHGNPNMPAGAGSFPSLHNVNFDLLPMTIGQASSNLFYWNGADVGGDGLTIADVKFASPSGVAWEVLDANFNEFSATGSDAFVPGGLIQRTSSDIDPFDGVDSGSIHKHLVLTLDDNDGNSGTTPAAGVYMIAWQARSAGFEPSEPFLFVHRTFGFSTAAHDLAVQWATANYDALTTPVVKGDYDGDADVDGADFLAWQLTLGAAATPPGQGADGNVNGAIDGPDLALWRSRFPTTPPALAAVVAIPEPAAAILALAALACPGMVRRRFSTF